MKTLTKKKKIVFTCILLAILLLFLETAAFLTYLIKNKRAFPRSEYRSLMFAVSKNNYTADYRNERIESGGGAVYDVIHPYLGFVQDPQREKTVSNYGFPDNVNPIVSRLDNKVVIGVFGGSFAKETYIYGRNTLVKVLQSMGKDINVINFAMGGYKQQQQLLTLAYFLSLGAEFDIIINIDGFNEVALPPAENIPMGVFPVYPRSWYFKVANLFNDPGTLTQIARLWTLEQKRKNWAQFFIKRHLYHSIALCLLWQIRDKLLVNERSEAILALKKYNKRIDSSYLVTGPPYSFPNDKALYDYLANVWKRCSLQMNAICEANGIRYYHFLQPNQYVEGSKPMKKEEIEIAINNKHIYKPGAVMGIPYLRKYGDELIDLGVNFRDLTMIFSDVEEVIYRDDCCHLNEEGYKIIANTIGLVIIDDWINER